MYATKAFFTKNSTFVQSKAGLNADHGSTASQGCPRFPERAEFAMNGPAGASIFSTGRRIQYGKHRIVVDDDGMVRTAVETAWPRPA
jgi:hypothetical protein